MIIRRRRLARHAGESEYPFLWDGLTLGFPFSARVSGDRYHDISLRRIDAARGTNANGLNLTWDSDSRHGTGLRINGTSGTGLATADAGIKLTKKLVVPALSNFSLFASIGNCGTLFGNPGFFRSGDATPTGTTFCILTSATGCPWIRVNGTNVLNPASGAVVPATGGSYTTAYTWRNGIKAAWFLDGKERHSATSAVTTAAFDLRYFGWQTRVDGCIVGTYHSLLFYLRELKASDVQILHDDPIAPFRLKTSVSVRVPDAPGGTVVPIFDHYYRQMRTA